MLHTVIIPIYLLEEDDMKNLIQRAHEISDDLADETDCAELAPMVKILQAELIRRNKTYSLD